MNTASRITRGIVGSITVMALLVMPTFASAGTAAVLTNQVLPPGGNTCAPLMVTNVTPYIYDGELQSFDIGINDPSYVAVIGAAGDVGIPFNYMTRRMHPDGTLRIHADTTATINGKLPVTVTFLSALPGKPVCLSTVSFTTDLAGNIESSAPISVPTSPIDTGTDVSGSGTSGGSVAGSHTNSNGGSNGGSGKPVTGTTSATSTSGTSTIGSVVSNMCSKNGAYQLWFILLAIFFVIAAFVGLSEPALALRHGALPAVLIGLPLVLLLLFWQLAPDCRLSYFIPIILLVAGAIGLYSAYRTNPVVRPAIALPAEKKTTVVKTEETKTEIK